MTELAAHVRTSTTPVKLGTPARLTCFFAVVLATCCASPAASGQITYLTRNGQHLAGCGPLVGGLSQTASFSVPASTAPQTLSVADPGPPLTNASITFDALALPSVFSLAQSGAASRGATVGAFIAVADCRETWQFTLSAPACFTLSASMSLAASTPGDAIASVLFGGPPITLADGSVVASIGHNITSGNGQFSGSWFGTLAPGTYLALLNQRVNAVGFPFAGSFDGHLTLTLSPAGGACPPPCDSIDFNGDGLFPDTADIDDFLSVFSGGPCSNDPTCGDIDFNNDGLFPDTLDIDAFLSVFSGGVCL